MLMASHTALREIPPRARRRASQWPLLRIITGNTSACAEKSRSHLEDAESAGKYLRVRGEESIAPGEPDSHEEIPPRARRRAGLWVGAAHDFGNTSACAEKRAISMVPWCVARKYLRVRGEEIHHESKRGLKVEIPPRARRRGNVYMDAEEDEGNTSACAEKSCGLLVCGAVWRKYLRVRGEERQSSIGPCMYTEIPPRARRRECLHLVEVFQVGNTSACAEKSDCGVYAAPSIWKYLRVRGEELSPLV
ncbi:Uncharacterised protein [Corynebacterium striatum]|nr:Uncharacterised protein [Corynebacterium striatum]